jgi:hypothetical protein
VNKKTLLDEFAMAAMNGWLASRHDPAVTIQGSKAAASFYDLAESMMAERAKRMPQAADREATPLCVSVPFFDPQAEFISQYVRQRKGQRMTCTEILRGAFWLSDTVKPDQETLLRLGKILRQIGLKRCRSGGKDYYQL